MADVDALSRNLISGATRLADRGAALARGVALLVGLIAVSAYLTGLAGLEGASRSVWMVVGAVLLVLVVGAPVLARRRLRILHRHATELVAEVSRLLTGDANAQRVVIDIDTAQPGADGATLGSMRPAAPGSPVDPAVVAQSHRYGEFRKIVQGADDLRQLPAAIAAITSFPALIAIGLMGAVVFGLLGFVFLLALVF